MSINPYDSPLAPGQRPEPPPVKRGFRLLELLAVIGVIGLLIALLLPNVRSAREAARRSQCSGHLTMIAVALHNYESDYGCLPPAHTVDATGKPLHSWRTLILPYLEQAALYAKIDLSKPWDDPANQAARDAKIATYQCPSADLPAGHTTYLAVVSPGSCLQPARPRPLAEITDGHNSTLIVLDVNAEHAVHWMSPADAGESLALSFAAAGQTSHPGGTQGLFVDGTVRFLSQSTKLPTLRTLISIAGDDEVANEAND
jgi:type II secretory pathway pseudopilin PulG